MNNGQPDQSGALHAASTPERADHDAPQRSPAEAFRELTGTIERLNLDVLGIKDYVDASASRLIEHVEVARHEGREAGIWSLVRVHGMIFTRRQEAGDRADPGGFNRVLLEVVEDELNQLGVEIVCPSRGDALDLSVMRTLGTVERRMLQRSGRVEQVVSCGYRLRDPLQAGSARLLRQAEVVITRGRSDLPEVDVSGPMSGDVEAE